MRVTAIAIIFSIQIEGLTDWNTGQVPIMREFWFLLGLAIAKSIVNQYKGKIDVNCKDGYTTFKVIF